MSKKKYNVNISRLTINKEYKYPWQEHWYNEEIVFSKTFNTAYWKGLTFEKIKGGGCFGGNYLCIEQDDEYKINQK